VVKLTKVEKLSEPTREVCQYSDFKSGAIKIGKYRYRVYVNGVECSKRVVWYAELHLLPPPGRAKNKRVRRHRRRFQYMMPNPFQHKGSPTREAALKKLRHQILTAARNINAVATWAEQNL